MTAPTHPTRTDLPAPVSSGTHRGDALRCLALDQLTAHTVGLLRADGIDCLLLKGPGLAARLYPEDPAARVYTDVDILVTPEDFDTACRLLVQAGFQWRLQGVGDGEFPWYEAPLAAPPGLVGAVDLHRGFAGVARSRELFDTLGGERETMTVGGAPVDVPGPVGTTLLALLHAASPGRARHPLVDLARADALMDDPTWTAAFRWGHALGAGTAVAAATELLSPARQDHLREAVGGTGPAVPAHLWLAGRQQSRVSVNLARVLHEQSGARAVIRQITRRVFPSPAFVALWDPRATQGPRGLALAYASRLRRAVTEAPRAVRDLRRAHRSGAAVTGARPHRSGILDPQRWAAATWAVASAAVLHRRLRRAPLADVRVPPPRPTPRPQDRHAIARALHLARVPCLPTALIWQEWHGRLGRPRDVVVGVRRDDDGTVGAHAWLDGDDPQGDFTALHRHRWPVPDRSAPTPGQR